MSAGEETEALSERSEDFDVARTNLYWLPMTRTCGRCGRGTKWKTSNAPPLYCYHCKGYFEVVGYQDAVVCEDDGK